MPMLLSRLPLAISIQGQLAAVRTSVSVVLLTARRLLSLLPPLQTAGHNRESDLNLVLSRPDAAAAKQATGRSSTGCQTNMRTAPTQLQRKQSWRQQQLAATATAATVSDATWHAISQATIDCIRQARPVKQAAHQAAAISCTVQH